jgi:hypothetical protein
MEKRERDQNDTGGFSGPEACPSFLIFRNQKHAGSFLFWASAVLFFGISYSY